MPLILPNTIQNEIPADGDKLGQNFDTIVDWANQEAITRDGSTGMVSPLLLSGPPTQANQAATKGYVDNWAPVGVMWMYPGNAAEPAGWMHCRGQAISRATYAALYALIGDTYGAGNGTTTFNLPSFQGRMPMGYWPGGGYGATPGGMGGTADAIVVAHNHAGVDHVHGVNINTGTVSVWHTHNLTDIGEVIRHNPLVPGGRLAFTASGGLPVDIWQVNGRTTTNPSDNHIHNVSGTTGAADRSLTTGVAGSSGTNANIPPFTTVNFIMKVA